MGGLLCPHRRRELDDAGGRDHELPRLREEIERLDEGQVSVGYGEPRELGGDVDGLDARIAVGLVGRIDPFP